MWEGQCNKRKVAQASVQQHTGTGLFEPQSPISTPRSRPSMGPLKGSAKGSFLRRVACLHQPKGGSKNKAHPHDIPQRGGVLFCGPLHLPWLEALKFGSWENVTPPILVVTCNFVVELHPPPTPEFSHGKSPKCAQPKYPKYPTCCPRSNGCG